MTKFVVANLYMYHSIFTTYLKNGWELIYDFSYKTYLSIGTLLFMN